MLVETKQHGLPQYHLVMLALSPYRTPFAKPLTRKMREILRCSPGEANSLAEIAYSKGSVVLCKTGKERAEFLADQFKKRNFPVPVIFSKLWEESS